MICTPAFCRRSLLVRPDGSTVDHLDRAVMRGADRVHQPIPCARLSPSYEAIVAGGAWAIALRQVSPGSTGSQHPENAVQHATVIDAGTPRGLLGKSGSITRHSKSVR